jgi:hypothetical protein
MAGFVSQLRLTILTFSAPELSVQTSAGTKRHWYSPLGSTLEKSQALRFARVFLTTEPFATPPMVFPLLIAATSHLGLRPRPAQVSDGFSGLRNLGATAPRGPPRPLGHVDVTRLPHKAWRRTPAVASHKAAL